MKQFEPIFFTPPLTKWNRQLYKGGGGGDGGAAERKVAEDARIAAGIKKVNEVFGLANPTPDAVDRNQFNRTEVLQSNGSFPNSLPGVARQEVWLPSEQPGLFTKPYQIGGMTGQSGRTRTVFDEAGYNAAVAAAQAKADKLKGAGAAREALYSKIGKDTSNTALLDLNKERDITERELNFSLARNGLSGGSRDIDANRDVLDTYQQGVLKSSNLGLQTANNARSNDEKTRVNLINSITAGLTEGDAVTQAYSGMSNNARAAQDEANNASLAGFFDVLRNQQERAQYNAGANTVFNGDANQAIKKKYGGSSNSTYGGTIRG